MDAMTGTVPTEDIKPSPLRGVRLMDLKSHHCRWLLDERDEDGLKTYCGKPRVLGSTFWYCEEHRRKSLR